MIIEWITHTKSKRFGMSYFFCVITLSFGENRSNEQEELVTGKKGQRAGKGLVSGGKEKEIKKC